MTDGIWAAAIYGAIAGAAGGLIGALLAMPFKGAAKRYIPIAVVVAAVALAQPVSGLFLSPISDNTSPSRKPLTISMRRLTQRSQRRMIRFSVRS
jgi:hypothetical protein